MLQMLVIDFLLYPFHIIILSLIYTNYNDILIVYYVIICFNSAYISRWPIEFSIHCNIFKYPLIYEKNESLNLM